MGNIYLCVDCDTFFCEEEATCYTEEDTGAYIVLCPFCGSDFLEECTPCKICGNPATDFFCDKCMSAVGEAMADLRDRLDTGYWELGEIVAQYFDF